MMKLKFDLPSDSISFFNERCATALHLENVIAPELFR